MLRLKKPNLPKSAAVRRGLPLMAVGIAVMLYLAGVSLADNPTEVDVGELKDGGTFTKTWYTYNAAGLKLTNLTPGYLLMVFENGSGSQVVYDGDNIGVMTDDFTTAFAIYVWNTTQLYVTFQAVADTKVTITWYDHEQIEVPNGGLYIDGYVQELGNRYHANFSLEGGPAYAVNITAHSDTEYLGLVNGSIARYGWGDGDFDLRSNVTGNGLAFIGRQVKHFHAKVTQTTYEGTNFTTPVNANESVSWINGVVDIAVTSSEYSDYSNDTYMPSSIVILSNVIRGISVEVATPIPPEYTVTTYYHDIELEYVSATVRLNSTGVLNVTGNYRLKFTNETNSSASYPNEYNQLIEQLHGAATLQDDDRDGFPEVELWFRDVEITNGGDTITTLSTYSMAPDLVGGNQPDEDDGDPAIPNEAGDLDGDGLSNYWEVLRFGSDPLNNDTDDDGTNDYYEYLNVTFTDSDDDGLDDTIENSIGSNPLARDSDGDGFEDGAEYAYWYHHNSTPTADIDSDGYDNINDAYSDLGAENAEILDYNYYYDKDGIEFLLLGTNTQLRDTDGDGAAYIMSGGSATNVTMSDGKEAAEWLAAGLDYFADSDGDGICNLKDGDSDGDGVDDWLEWTVWGYYHTLAGFSATGRSSYTSNPTTNSSDGDGISDYAEIYTYHTDPGANDSDGDGLSDPLELSLAGSGDTDSNQTNPVKEDTDGDGLNDSAEDTDKDGGVDATETDPLDWDSDDDTLSDGFESEYSSLLDPLVWDNASLDNDGDGITEYGEMLNNTSPLTNDTDSDDMLDKWEIDNGTDPLVDDAGEDPDDDGLSNLAEFQGWSISVSRFVALNTTVNLTTYNIQSYPLYADIDGDGVLDGAEKELSLDPTSYDTDWDGLWDIYEAHKPNLTTPAFYTITDYENWTINDIYVMNDGNIFFTVRNANGYDWLQSINGTTGNLTNHTYHTSGIPRGLTGDGEGNLYYVLSTGELMRYTPATDTSTELTDELDNPRDVAVDANGNIFIAEEGTNNMPTNETVNGTWNGTSSIKQWNASAGLTTVVSGLNRTRSVAVDEDGNLFISEYGIVHRYYDYPANWYSFSGGRLSYYDAITSNLTTILDEAWYSSLNFDVPGDLFYVETTAPPTGNYSSIDAYPVTTNNRMRKLITAYSGGSPHLTNESMYYPNASGYSGVKAVRSMQGRLYWATPSTIVRSNVTTYSNATHWDSDNDSLPDGMEIYGWEINVSHTNDHTKSQSEWQQYSYEHPLWYTWHTSCDPTIVDTDSDGLGDYQEFINYSDPNNIDTDDDGLDDYEEVVNYTTLPYLDDTDRDYLPDGLEAGVKWDADSNTTTNLTNPDTDGDGIIDGKEDKNRDGEWTVHNPVWKTDELDPNDADSDGDGLEDGKEEYTEWFRADTREPLTSGNLSIVNIEPEQAFNGQYMSVSNYVYSARIFVGITGIEGRYLNISIGTNDTNQTVQIDLFNGSNIDNETANSTIHYLSFLPHELNSVLSHSYYANYSVSEGPLLWATEPFSGSNNSNAIACGRNDGWYLEVNNSDPNGSHTGQVEYFQIELRSATHPLRADADNDSLNDSAEVQGIYGFVSNPWRVHSDDDFITDYDEVMGTEGFITDPLNRDTDYDTYRDDHDINPLGTGTIEVEITGVDVDSSTWQDAGENSTAEIYIVARVSNSAYDSGYIRTDVITYLENGSSDNNLNTKLRFNIDDDDWNYHSYGYNFNIEIQVRDLDDSHYDINDDELLDTTTTDSDSDGKVDVSFNLNTEAWSGDTSTGSSSGSDGSISFSISVSSLPKINTIFILPKDGNATYNATRNTSTTSDDMVRYIGEMKFYVFDLELGEDASDPFVEGINKIIIPQSVLYASAFYNHTLETDDISDIDYLPSDAEWVAPGANGSSDPYIVNSIVLQYLDESDWDVVNDTNDDYIDKMKSIFGAMYSVKKMLYNETTKLSLSPIVAQWLLYNLTHNQTSDNGQNWTNQTAYVLGLSGEELYQFGLPMRILNMIPNSLPGVDVWDSEIEDEDESWFGSLGTAFVETIGGAVNLIANIIQTGAQFTSDVRDLWGNIGFDWLPSWEDVKDKFEEGVDVVWEKIEGTIKSILNPVFQNIKLGLQSYIMEMGKNYLQRYINVYSHPSTILIPSIMDTNYPQKQLSISNHLSPVYHIFTQVEKYMDKYLNIAWIITKANIFILKEYILSILFSIIGDDKLTKLMESDNNYLDLKELFYDIIDGKKSEIVNNVINELKDEDININTIIEDGNILALSTLEQYTGKDINQPMSYNFLSEDKGLSDNDDYDYKFAILLSNWDEKIKKYVIKNTEEMYYELKNQGFSDDNTVLWSSNDINNKNNILFLSEDGSVNEFDDIIDQDDPGNRGHPGALDVDILNDTLSSLKNRLITIKTINPKAKIFIYFAIFTHGTVWTGGPSGDPQYGFDTMGFGSNPTTYRWVVFANKLSITFKDQSLGDLYSDLFIFAPQCTSGGAITYLSLTNLSNMVIITGTKDGDYDSHGLPGSHDSIIYGTLIGHISDDYYKMFKIVFQQVFTAYAPIYLIAVIVSVIIACSTVGMATPLFIAVVGTIILYPMLIAEFYSLIMFLFKTRTINDVYDRIVVHAKWGYIPLIWGNSEPQIYNSNIAKSYSKTII